MWLPYDCKEIGQVSTESLETVINLVNSANWDTRSYSRYEKTLRSGKVILLPYLIYKHEQPFHTKEQKNIIEAIKPVVDEVMVLFPNYHKIRGEIAALLPGRKLIPHYDNRLFHQHCMRVHVPIVTNDSCTHYFEGRQYHFEPRKIYYYNNRIVHSAINLGTSVRVHLILDLLEDKVYNSFNPKQIAYDLYQVSIPDQYKNEKQIY